MIRAIKNILCVKRIFDMTSSYHHQMMSPRRWTQSIVGRTAEGRAQCQEAAAPKVYCLCEDLVRVGLKLLKKNSFL